MNGSVVIWRWSSRWTLKKLETNGCQIIWTLHEKLICFFVSNFYPIFCFFFVLAPNILKIFLTFFRMQKIKIFIRPIFLSVLYFCLSLSLSLFLSLYLTLSHTHILSLFDLMTCHANANFCQAGRRRRRKNFPKGSKSHQLARITLGANSLQQKNERLDCQEIKK